MPDAGGKAPAVVLASAVHGVDKDVQGIADEIASHGYLFPGNKQAYSQSTREFSMKQAPGIPGTLR